MYHEKNGDNLYATYSKLLEHAAELVSELRSHELPTREYSQYSVPIQSHTYSEFPSSLRDYVYSDEITELVFEFITETDEDGVQHWRVDLLMGSRDRTLMVTADENEELITYLSQGKNDPKKIGAVDAGEVAKLVLTSLNVNDSSLEGVDLSEANVLRSDRSEILQYHAEKYGVHTFTTKSYEMKDGSSVQISESGSEAGHDLPDDIKICLMPGNFSVIIDAKDRLSITIFDDGQEIVKPDDILMKEINDAIVALIERVRNRDGAADLELVDPEELDTIPGESL